MYQCDVDQNVLRDHGMDRVWYDGHDGRSHGCSVHPSMAFPPDTSRPIHREVEGVSFQLILATFWPHLMVVVALMAAVVYTTIFNLSTVLAEQVDQLAVRQISANIAVQHPWNIPTTSTFQA